ncbi:hypothetical protein ACPPVO_06390 [Dactylosporangium sp. McL0621]|uniref:hypothetical protein n=1 Tax=Dactylosporangium sp. McL0621 TaxID=3415678 RepID=UPI003CEF3A27
MEALRRTRVVTRLVVGFLVVSLCVVAIWLSAISAAGGTRDTAERLAASQAQLDAAQQLKFRITDISGWQVGYAFDIVRGLPGAAKVSSIQADTTAATEAINRIVEVTGRLGDYQTTIAAAVEEQTATTDEMSRSIAQAAAGSADIAANIAGISAAARVTTEGVEDTRTVGEELSAMSRELHGLVGQFPV